MHGHTYSRYDYDDAAAVIVETLHDEWLYNQELSQRLVESGAWTYLVDLQQVSGGRGVLHGSHLTYLRLWA